MLKATKGFTKGNLTLFQYFFIKSEQKSFYEHSPRVENDSKVKINVSHYCKINRTLITKSEGAFLAAYMLL